MTTHPPCRQTRPEWSERHRQGNEEDAGKRADGTNVKMAHKELERLGPEFGKMKIEGLEKVANIDTEAMQRTVNESMSRQRDALRMRNADWTSVAPYIEKKSNTFAVKGVPKVSIDAKGCSVKVRGWDRPEVKYVVTELADRRNSQAPASVIRKCDRFRRDIQG